MSVTKYLTDPVPVADRQAWLKEDAPCFLDIKEAMGARCHAEGAGRLFFRPHQMAQPANRVSIPIMLGMGSFQMEKRVTQKTIRRKKAGIQGHPVT